MEQKIFSLCDSVAKRQVQGKYIVQLSNLAIMLRFEPLFQELNSRRAKTQ